MSYRNGTYIAFHAGGSSDPTASDIRYYRMMKAWHEHDDIEFRFVNSHEKTASVRDSSSRETLRRRLVERLNSSKNMVLIIGPTTKFDIDWVPFEVAYAVDNCRIPIVAAYTGYKTVTAPHGLSYLWPQAFATRIASGVARVIHIPFRQRVIDDAIRQFDYKNPPSTAQDYYSLEAHRFFGIQC